MLSEKDDLKSAVEKAHENSIKWVFYVLLTNILQSFRILNNDKFASLQPFALKPNPEKIQAYGCLKAIMSVFPEIKKMQKFLTNIDKLFIELKRSTE